MASNAPQAVPVSVLPKIIQQQIIALRDEAEYYRRRAEEANEILGRFISKLGLPNGVEIAVIPIQQTVESEQRSG